MGETTLKNVVLPPKKRFPGNLPQGLVEVENTFLEKNVFRRHTSHALGQYCSTDTAILNILN